jgi:hypothetical protein
MPIRSYQLKQGKLVEIQRKPGESEKLQERVSKQFGPNGEDLLFQQNLQRLGRGSKRKLPRAA